ncbi:hypothetical protein [Mycobacteroides abscessus]|uniref:hypothetical protein n=1 Tax=Mycobacteroides abscessus TaxID=36809 RepID=UPI000925AD10|nr:hypothetical protein [Mycobacteroides abscessus]QSM04923.1 hypothetical protein PROPHIGD91-4_72 [Mycobacterium phage prophi91-4]MDO3335168.1 hypothetical protein [Mycobacteroides abscessus subsp. bolletii]QSM87798.1 hypothetical protein I3U44_18540 [Mycobacteroides abscessus subsp. bolletii]SIB02190.1 Uncharacterised protein [Mycobacteroides abscessus subsp. bolletii]SII68943.1 Uncharacterised protein [Mycobacteroides abscessus subsp. bolletii]
MTFEQAQFGFIKAKDADGSDVWFKPLNLSMHEVETGIELSFAGPYTLTVQGTVEEYLEFLDPTPADEE